MSNGLGLGVVDEGEDHACFGTELPIDFAFGINKEGEATLGSDFRSHHEVVAGADGVFEAYLVKTRVHRGAALKLVEHKNAAALAHNLAKDDARDNGVAREMALDKELITSDMVLAMCILSLASDLIDKKHRFPVRKIVFYLISIHFF